MSCPACRSPQRGQVALERLLAQAPAAHAEVRLLDLADLAAVRAFADSWVHDRLDLLVNHGGVAMVPFTRTSDGFESQLGEEPYRQHSFSHAYMRVDQEALVHAAHTGESARTVGFTRLFKRSADFLQAASR